MIGVPEPDNAKDRFALELSRTSSLLRSMDARKLEQAHRAAKARDFLAELASAALAAEGLEPRDVPYLADTALGDQLAVIGRDLLSHGPDEALDVWAQRLIELRRVL